MSDDSISDIKPGGVLEAAMLSPCVGGLVRTWTETRSSLWAVDDPAAIASRMGRGLIARTVREERRYREVGLLVEASGVLLLQSRFPTASTEGSVEVPASRIRLTEAGPPSSSVVADLLDLLTSAVGYTVEIGGFLVVERGGWDAPDEPYCLVVITPDDGGTSVIEASPAPVGAALWEGTILPGAAGATLSAPATPESISVVPTLIVDALSTWGLEPWDLALTYGQPE